MGERTAAWALGSGMRACLVIDADSEFWELETNVTGNLLIFALTSWGKFIHKHWKTDLFCEPSLIDLGY